MERSPTRETIPELHRTLSTHERDRRIMNNIRIFGHADIAGTSYKASKRKHEVCNRHDTSTFFWSVAKAGGTEIAPHKFMCFFFFNWL